MMLTGSTAIAVELLELQSLREQLAIREAEVAELKSWNLEVVKQQDRIADKCDELEKERDQLREHVKMLRDALECCKQLAGYPEDVFKVSKEALAATEPKE